MSPTFRVVERGRASEADELIAGLLPRTGVALLVGQSTVGKSFFALMLAAAVATGKSVTSVAGTSCGQSLHSGATIYVAGEGVSGLGARIAACEAAYSGGVGLPITPVELGDTRLMGERSGDLKLVVEKHHGGTVDARGKVRLIVFDTLISTFQIRDENSNAEMQSVLDALRAYAALFDCLVLATVHPGKGRGARRQGVRGASATFNGADVVLSLSKFRDGRRWLSVVKMRDGATVGQQLHYEIVPVGHSAFMRPLAARVSIGDTESATPMRALAMLSVIERAWASSPVQLVNFLDQLQPAATVSEIVHAYVSLDAKRAREDGRPATKPDTLRKRIERALPQLVEATYVEKIEIEGTSYYVACSGGQTEDADKPPPPPPPPLATPAPTA